ncbi:anti-sigma factor family protein [Falsiroseomonas sp. HW251]|uniref:anti-sigma factor family protein n=1 Tax=Falsiroseomonas sp. HW251 TaxID=3390998 RepID=UPI003D31606A
MSDTREAPRCAAMEPLLHALADGELDAANVLRCEAHLRNCPHCAAAFAGALATRDALRQEGVRHAAPAALRARILDAVDAAAAGTAAVGQGPRGRAGIAPGLATWRGWWNAWRLPALTLGTGLAAAALLVAPALRQPDGMTTDIRRDVVDGHVRSLLIAGRLTDVDSSDRHTVKPWFAGRLDFSPPVPDIADAGFPLTGGRLDYFEGRSVAALVYRRRAHVINVFVWPDRAGAGPTVPQAVGPDSARDGGHVVVRWREGSMVFWAVSDLNAAELTDFARMFITRAAEARPS